MKYRVVFLRILIMKVLLLTLYFFVICRASSWSGPPNGECIFDTDSPPDKFIELKHLNPNCDSEAEALAYSIEVKKI